MIYVADKNGNLHREDEPVAMSRFVQTDDGWILIKSTRKQGQPKTDIERVMTHYDVDEKTAKKMLATKSVEELLPERGAGLSKSTVKAHTRKTKTGKIANVSQYQNVKTKKTQNLSPEWKRVNAILYKKAKHANSLEEFINKVSNGKPGTVDKNVLADVYNKVKADRDDKKPAGKKSKKLYDLQYNVGKAKYVVSYHDGKTKNRDGSPFWGIRLFGNIKKRDAFIKDLKSQNYSYNSGLSKSLEFDISGQRIKDSIILKVSELRNKLETMRELFNNQKPVNNTNQTGDVIDANPVPADIAKNATTKWEIESLERTIAELEREARNIDVKKKFKLSSYDLKTYGL